MRSSIRLAVALVFGLAVLPAVSQESASYQVPAGTAPNIRRAVESAARTDEQRARDVQRKPAEVMTLAGIEQGQRVVELASFGHYYTTMLVEAVGASGHVYMIDMPWTDRFGGEAARAFDAAHENATYLQMHYNEMTLPENVDVVMNVLFYHDLVRDNVDTADMNSRIFSALEPGGTYIVIDHNAASGSGWRDAESLHRIDAGTIRSEVLSAGFELALESGLLSNPDDVPSLAIRAPEVRGQTDRALFVFRKPRR